MTTPGPMKQRAPMRAPSPTIGLRAISRRGIDVRAGRDASPPDARRDAAADRDAAASRRARRWRADWPRPATGTGEAAADFASRMTAPARVSASCATYLGLARKVIDSRTRLRQAPRRNPRSRPDRRAAHSRNVPPVRRASLSWRSARAPEREPVRSGLRGRLRGRRRAPVPRRLRRASSAARSTRRR